MVSELELIRRAAGRWMSRAEEAHAQAQAQAQAQTKKLYGVAALQDSRRSEFLKYSDVAGSALPNVVRYGVKYTVRLR